MSTPTPTPPKKTLAQELGIVEGEVKSWAATKPPWIMLVVGIVMGWSVGHFWL